MVTTNTAMNWHLHVTVSPHKNWTHANVVEALSCDLVRLHARPLVITNHFHIDPTRNYKELIPTKHFEGDEAAASREIFHMGVVLNNSGWRVRRLKIEGDARDANNHRRAIYFETHIKNASILLPFPCSSSLKGNVFHTVRCGTTSAIRDRVLNAYADTSDVCPLLEMEAAVLDTAPELDHDWINQ